MTEPSDDTEAGTIILVGRGGWALLEEVARVAQWRRRRQRLRLAILWGLSFASALAAVWASGWRP